MKKIILTLAIILSAFQLTFAQWVGTTNMYNTNTGNVGVGITSPTALFHVSSLQYIPAASGSAQNSGFRLGATATTNLVLDAGVNTSGAVYTWLQSRNQSDYSSNYSLILNPNGGNVGIGTNNPAALLYIGSSSNRGTLTVAGSTTQTPVIGLADIRTGGHGYSIYSGLSAAGDFNIFDQTASAYRFTISSSGYLGIGTTSPQANLHILGAGALIDGGNSYEYSGAGLIVQGNSGSRSTTSGAQLEFVIPANTDGSNPWGQARIITVAGNSNSSDATGKMIMGTRRMFNKLGTGGQWYYGNDLTIDGNGLIGVGTTTPSSKLDVNGRIGMQGFGFLSSLRNPNNNYTNLFLGGALADNGDGTFTTSTDGGSNYFSAIRMDGSGGAIGAINFYNGASTGGTSYNITNANLASYLTMSVVGGSVCIGTTNPNGYKLAVNGSVIAVSVNIKPYANWPDYVFKPTYHLPSLADVKTYIDKNQHLPDMPSAADVAKDGINLGEINKLLTKKVEELTLYLIEKDKAEKEQAATLKSQQQQIDELKQQVLLLIKAQNKN